jgi:hypothetical protein
MALRATAARPQVQVVSSPAIEFLMSLAVVSHPADQHTLEVGGEWLQAVRSRAGDELLSRVHGLSGRNRYPWIELLHYAVSPGIATGVGELLGRIRRADPVELCCFAAGCNDQDGYDSVPFARIADAIGNGRRARVPRAAYGGSGFVRYVIENGAAATKREIVQILAAWAERVWPGEIGHLEVIDRDAEGKRRLSRSLSFGRFMVRATGGIYLRHLPAGIDTVVLAPSYVSRPWVNSTMANGALVIVAPVSDASLGPAESLPQRRYARLANAYRARHRLELMRALAQGEKTLAELAAGLDVPAGRLRRDLLSLRTAGLVQLSGETHRFRMSSGSVSDLGQLLGASLGAPRGAPPN